MRELEKLIKELKEHLTTKEAELRKLENFNSHTVGAILNRQRDIESFEVAVKNCEQNPYHRSEVIANFTKNAESIKSEIDKVMC